MSRNRSGRGRCGRPSPTPASPATSAASSTARGPAATSSCGCCTPSRDRERHSTRPAATSVTSTRSSRRPVSRSSPRPRTTRSPPPTCSSCSPSTASARSSCAASAQNNAARPRRGSHPTSATRSRSSPRRPPPARSRTATPPRARRSSSCSRTRARCQPARSSSGPSTRLPGGSRPSPRSRRPPARSPCPRPCPAGAPAETLKQVSYPDQIVTKVVFLLVPGLHLLDLAGPAQAFGTAADLGCGYQLAYVAGQEDVPTAQGVTVKANTHWPALAKNDLIIVPGWRANPVIAGTGPLADATLEVLAAHHAGGGTVASVCAGTDALGRAGLLDGRRCTTHHDIQDELAWRYPTATVIRDVLYVIDGRVATSAGIASGIDLALHLIAVRDGPATAARVAREMVVYARRNGDERQVSALLRHRSHLSDTAHRAQDHIEARFARPLPLAEIASQCGVSERTLTRRFTEATGLTPLRYQQLLRLERAEHLIGHGATVEAAARTVGFEDPRMLRRLRARESGCHRPGPNRLTS